MTYCRKFKSCLRSRDVKDLIGIGLVCFRMPVQLKSYLWVFTQGTEQVLKEQAGHLYLLGF